MKPSARNELGTLLADELSWKSLLLFDPPVRASRGQRAAGWRWRGYPLFFFACAVLVIIDWQTGLRVSVLPAYVVLTGFAGWRLGFVPAAVGALAMTTAMPLLTGQTHDVVVLWNAVGRAAALVSIAYLVALHRVTNAALGALESEAGRDPLTHALNLRSLHPSLRRALALCRDSGVPFSLLHFDLDRFKAVNDEYGHHVGDALLRQVVAIADGAIRETDLLARVGGDEFVAVLPDACAHQARDVAQRVCAAIDAALHGRYGVTTSIGVATWTQAPSKPEGLVEAVDRLMYVAKRAGGNRVVSELDGRTLPSPSCGAKPAGARRASDARGSAETPSTTPNAVEPGPYPTSVPGSCAGESAPSAVLPGAPETPPSGASRALPGKGTA